MMQVELLLENYCSQLVGIAQEAYYLRKRVESTQSIVELRLDAYRNYMLRINVQLAIASISLAGGTVLAGFFGMNLTSGLEVRVSFCFWCCCCCCLAVWESIQLLVFQARSPTLAESKTKPKSKPNQTNT
jgi:magnesium transporter